MNAGSRSLGRRGTGLAAVQAAAAVALLAACVSIWLTTQRYKESIYEARVESRNVATLLAAQLQTSLLAADSQLRQLQRDVLRSGLSPDSAALGGASWDRELDARIALYPALHGLRVFGSSGDLVITNDRAHVQFANIRDRPHFRRAAASNGPAPVLADILVSRTTGKRLFVIARPLFGGNGGFSGVATASIEFDHFFRLSGAVDLGVRQTVAIYNTETFLPLVRWPRLPEDPLQALPESSPTRKAVETGARALTAVAVSPVDGIERAFTSIRIEGYPLLVLVGISTGDALREWYTRTLPLGAVAVVLASMLLFLLGRLFRTESELIEMSFRDSLTGLYNRRFMDASLRREIASAHRHKQALSVVMLDIDHFKQVNDRFGHAIGDEVLERLGERLIQLTRSSDVACRYGGEEFTLILPKASLEDARRRADEIRADFASRAVVETPSGPLHVTLSAGVATLGGTGAAEELLQRADGALYEAKRAGRDRTCVAP